MKRRVVVLGSTGSVGTQALDVVGEAPDRFEVVGLAANGSVDLLLQQARRFRPRYVAVADAVRALALRERVSSEIRVLSGAKGVEELATMQEADFVLAAIGGNAGLNATMAAARAGKTVGLANKEALVMAGGLLVREAKRHGAVIVPVDSEHSALFQLLWRGGPPTADAETSGLWPTPRTLGITRLVLTASGGPFRTWSKAALRDASPEKALRHPIWSMGPKITVDSATLMNKSLEVVEAHWLFGADPGDIEILIHPQSIVHALVESVDGSLQAHLGAPDMRAPLAWALSFPERPHGSSAARVSISSLAALTFEAPDLERFPAASLGHRALQLGGTAPAVLAGADEAAVAAFLAGACRFDEIASMCGAALASHRPAEVTSLDDVFAAAAWGRSEVERACGSSTRR